MSNNNYSSGGNKHYGYRTSDISDDFQHFISTETRSWIIRDSDIRSDGSIPNAILMPSPRAKGVKIRRFSFHTLTRDERIN